MAKRKSIKHSKYKNTGFLFELLTRQITMEILNNDPNEVGKSIVKEFFSGKTQLAKELKLYNLLLSEKYNSEEKTEKFIEAVLKMRSKLDERKLSREKYNLVKAIKENFDINQFLSSPVNNYKVLASIHKLFEGTRENVSAVKDVFDSKYTIIEHITSKSSSKPTQSVDPIVEAYKNEEKDIRLLTYKILVENFNKKYDGLDKFQKTLLKEYIADVNNTSKFRNFYKTTLKSIVTDLTELHNSITDVVTKIKLSETINILKKQKLGRKITDEHVSALMLSHELVKELKSVKNEKE